MWVVPSWGLGLAPLPASLAASWALGVEASLVLGFARPSWLCLGVGRAATSKSFAECRLASRIGDVVVLAHRTITVLALARPMLGGVANAGWYSPPRQW